MTHRTILDTNVLIGQWRRQYQRTQSPAKAHVEAWAKEIVRLKGTNAIVTPVRLEFLAGTKSHEQELAKSYLNQFEVIDKGNITERDWKETERYACRIPFDGRPRDFADCLIRAIADRFRCAVDTGDQSFPKPMN